MAKDKHESPNEGEIDEIYDKYVDSWTQNTLQDVKIQKKLLKDNERKSAIHDNVIFPNYKKSMEESYKKLNKKRIESGKSEIGMGDLRKRGIAKHGVDWFSKNIEKAANEYGIMKDVNKIFPKSEYNDNWNKIVDNLEKVKTVREITWKDGRKVKEARSNKGQFVTYKIMK